MINEKIERIKEMPELKKEIISYLFDFVSRKQWGQWWKYKGNFVYENQEYDLECECKFDNQMFTYRNMYISHKQVEIDIKDLLKMKSHQSIQ